MWGIFMNSEDMREKETRSDRKQQKVTERLPTKQKRAGVVKVDIMPKPS